MTPGQQAILDALQGVDLAAFLEPKPVTEWTPFAGGEAQQTAIGEATNGLAEVRIVRPANERAIAFPPHEGELVFGFVLEGSAILEFGGRHDLARPDAFVIPPAEAWSLCDASPDLRLLHVTTARIA